MSCVRQDIPRHHTRVIARGEAPGEVKMIQQAPNASGAISWLVVNAHPLKERFAVENLNRRQFTASVRWFLSTSDTHDAASWS